MDVERTPHEDVGVIIGRFQAHELHEGHTQLIDIVVSRHDRVIVFLGLSVLRGTIADPLDFNARKVMFQESYPDIEVYYIDDCRDDITWSAKLDKELSRWCKPRQTVRLYGSRDSFLSHYKGKHNASELEATTFVSGTEIRKRIANNYRPTKDFRAGMIASAYNRYVGNTPTVDIAVVRCIKLADVFLPNEVLLGKKSKETAWRFIGGFADPNSANYEADALRELHEEAGVNLAVSPLQYVGSATIDDWRYRKQPEKIKTAFFVCKYLFGTIQPGDDIEVVGWVSLADLFDGITDIVPEHKPLLEMLKAYPLKKLS